MTTESLKFSILTATLNRKDFLPRCIDSVASQSYPNKEHIIVDGGSTDGTVQLLQEHSEKNPSIRWISEKDNGISCALNKALKMATGDVIGVCGDDDFYEPGAFEIVAREFEQLPSPGVVVGTCNHIRNDGSVWFAHKSSFTTRRDLIACWKSWGRTVIIPGQAAFFRKDVADVIGGFDEADKYAMDYRHWIKISEKFEVRTVANVLGNFRYDRGSITYSQAQTQMDEMCNISRDFWGPKTSLDFYRYWWSYFEYFKLRPIRKRIEHSFKYRVGRLLKFNS